MVDDNKWPALLLLESCIWKQTACMINGCERPALRLPLCKVFESSSRDTMFGQFCFQPSEYSKKCTVLLEFLLKGFDIAYSEIQ